MFFLIQKYLNRKTTPAEEEEILDWVLKSESNKQEFIQQIATWNNFQGNKKFYNSEKAFNILSKKLNRKEKPIRVLPLQKLLKYAAILFIAVPSLYFVYTNTRATGSMEEKMVSVPGEAAGEEHILLVKGDGSETIIAEGEEQLSYISSGDSIEKLSYNTLSVPRAKVFKLVLSDGTKVWLNADSKLKFPEKFLSSEENRMVYLEGEAFFEVSHNKDKAFIVVSGEVDIVVLGTKFNVSSYPSEDRISTTLVEGAVAITSDTNALDPIKLTPQHQSVFNKETRENTVSIVNTGDFTAWIDKRIIFKNKAFKDISSTLERTYNVNIKNNLKDFEQERFTGEFDIETIEDILITMKALSNFNYKINGRDITIY